MKSLNEDKKRLLGANVCMPAPQIKMQINVIWWKEIAHKSYFVIHEINRNRCNYYIKDALELNFSNTCGTIRRLKLVLRQ